MADRDAIRQRAINRRTDKLKGSIAWSDVVAAFQNATAQQRQNFASAIYSEHPRRSWEIIDGIMSAYLLTQATVEVDAAMADDSFTLQELEDLFL